MCGVGKFPTPKSFYIKTISKLKMETSNTAILMFIGAVIGAYIGFMMSK